ncbi:MULTISPECIES: c-type cytochrome [unclassified Variovorax]|uniref:c-type cytochrome n=1 Tax=unclassified Variovorax TaxID=663243 RepID=UPI003ECF6F98
MTGMGSPASALLAACVLASALACAPTASAQSRGELLYATHCIACHTTQVHWRDRKLATDWNSLKLQVRRWQAVAALDWSEEDVLEVTRHLNDSFYGFTPASNTVGVLVPAAHRSRDRAAGARP